MYIDWINENLEKIKNPDDVNIITTVGKGKNYLVARINNGEPISLMKPKFAINYPFEPIYWLAQELGRVYFEDFGVIFDNQIAINKNHLQKLFYTDEEKTKRVQLYAEFDDGNLILLASPLKKYFFKELKPQLERKFNLSIQEETNYELNQN